MTTRTLTYYTVETYGLQKFRGQSPYWSNMGSGPGGKTIEEARERVRSDMVRIGSNLAGNLNKVKFKIVKTVKTEEIVEEVLGDHASFYMLQD